MNRPYILSAAGPENVDLEDPEMQGVMPRAISQVRQPTETDLTLTSLYHQVMEVQVFRELKRRRLPEYKVGVTYIEIYNESFRDLLVPDTKSSDIGISERK
ncbi:hypothetical protein ABBQ32_003409 [Trebouxia sp. C0010 RCD-2024]